MKRLAVLLAVSCVAVVLALAAPGQDKAVDEKGNPVSFPKVVKKVSPVYPVEAKKEKVSGTVVLDLKIDQAGKVVAAKVSTSPDERLANAAVDAVKQWEFEPAKLEGKPVSVRATITVNFRLK